MLESMAVGYALQEAILDEDGRPKDFRYLEVNAAFEQLLGLPREQVLGRTVLEVFPKTEQYWMNIFSRVAMGGAPEGAEHFGVSLGRYFEVTASCP
ncbi:MAG: PAS domain-containing protein, partial [Marinobacter sp.]|nr:PAS domain-containing protein [Marinobacter sp.]